MPKTTTKTIYVTFKTVWGNEHIYPSCKDAHTFATMLGTKTLTPDAIKNIKRLGYTVEVVTNQPRTL